MEEFSTYIFKENELKTNNLRVVKERPYYIGILITLVGIILNLLDSPYTLHFTVLGLIVFTIGQIVLSGRNPSIGHRPVKLKITKDSVVIGKERIELKNRNDVQIRIIGYKGQGIVQQTAFYQTYSGNDNLMTIRYGDKQAEFKFVLESENHKDKLVKFCEVNEFELK